MNQRHRIPLRAWLIYAAMCSIFGTTFLAIKVGANAGVPPFLASGLRFSVAGAILLVVRLAPAVAGSRSAGLPWEPEGRFRDYLWRVMVLGVLIIGATFAFTYSAAESIGSGLIAQIQAISPVAVAIMSVVFLGARLGPTRILGLAAGFLGTGLLVGSAGLHGSRVAVTGALLAVSAEFTYSLGSVWFRRAFPRGTDSILANGFSMLTGGTVLLVLAVATGQTRAEWTAAALGSMGYLIVFGSIGAHTMYLWLVSNVSPLFASTWLFVSPVIATILGAVILGETVTAWNLAGMAAVLAGGYAVQRAEGSIQKRVARERPSIDTD